MICRLRGPRVAALALAWGAAACAGGGPEASAARGPDAALREDDPAAQAAQDYLRASGTTARADLAPFNGEAALRRGDLVEARRWLADARFSPRVAAHGFHMLGRLHLAEGDLPAAGAAFDRALRGAARDASVWVDIARLRYRGGEQVQAIAAADRALALGPANPAALLLRAHLVRDAHGHAASLPWLERGLAAAPDDPDLLFAYAGTLGELGRARDMLAAVRRMAEAAPRDRRALYLQAVLAARAGRNDLARSLLQRSGDLDRAMPGAALLLALIDLENGNFASAAQGFESLLRRQPNNRRIRLLLARALADGGRHRELIARFGTQADSPYLAALVGRAHEALGQRAAAAPFLDSAYARRGPRLTTLPSTTALEVAERRGLTDGDDAVGLVRGLIAAARAREARGPAQAFLAAHPGSADAMALAGDAALAAGDASAALALYRQAAAIRRPWPLTARMVWALDRLGREREGTELLAAHLAGEPANREARGWLARRSTS